jgi:hypothetical protein
MEILQLLCSRCYCPANIPQLSYIAPPLLIRPCRTQLSTDWVESSLMSQPTVSRPVCLGIKHPSRAYDQISITVQQLRVYVGRSLWRENGSVVHNCCWPSPAQSLSGPSPVWLATIFYRLRFETSLFVASYNLQGYGGGIRLRLHTGHTPIVFLIMPFYGPRLLQLAGLRWRYSTPPPYGTHPNCLPYNAILGTV